MDILNSPIVTGGIILSIATFLISHLKSTPSLLLDKLKQKFLSRVIVYDHDHLFYVLETWLNENYPNKCKNFEASYKFERTDGNLSPANEPAKTISKKKSVRLKFSLNIFTIKYKGKRFFIVKDKKELDNAKDVLSMLSFHYSITCLGSVNSIKGLLDDITDLYNEKTTGDKISIFTSNKWGVWKLNGMKNVKNLENVVFNKTLKKFLIEDIANFKDSREWYKQTNISYKRGYLFHGPGGTGKTTLAQAIASYLQRDIYILNVNSVKEDNDLMELFSNIPEDIVLLIEDIDCSFEQRKSLKENGVTFSCFINCVDGVVSKENTIMIMTTNHIEKLDPALIRTGRIDIRIEMPLAKNEEIIEYLSLFYNEDVILTEPKLSINMSSVQEACLKNRGNLLKAIEEIKSLN